MAASNTTFTKGQGGRKAGVPNKLTKTFKEALQVAVEEMQADPKTSLVTWAKGNPTEFWKIAAKLIPTELTGELGITTIKVVRDDK